MSLNRIAFSILALSASLGPTGWMRAASPDADFASAVAAVVKLGGTVTFDRKGGKRA